MQTTSSKKINFLKSLTLIGVGLFLFPAYGSLQDKQSEFAHLSAKLILKAEEMGYQVTFGEAWRTPEQAKFKTKLNAEKGIGIARSLHILRLAIDINLFYKGEYLVQVSDYLPLGEWWEKQCRQCRWGGRFKMKDAVHFSYEHDGIK